MKLKSTLFLSLLSAIISSCETADIIENSNNANQIRFTASDFQYEASTKTDFIISDTGAEFQWSENDTVGIFPDTGSQVYFPMASGAGTKTAVFDGGGWALKSSSTYAAYYPFKGNIYLNKTKIPVSYVGQNQVGNNSTEHLGAYDYMAAVASTPENGNVDFNFKHLGCLVQLNIPLEDACTVTSIILRTEDKSFVTKGSLDLTSSSISINNLEYSEVFTVSVDEMSFSETNQKATVYFMMAPVDLTGKEIGVQVYIEGASLPLSYSFTGIEFVAGSAYSLTATLNAAIDNSPAEAIDLGLPSGIKWASCNVGATSPEDYGTYYAWGEIETKSEYTKDNYKYLDYVTNEGGFTEESWIDIGSEISGTEYDVAHIKWGGKWRIPSSQEATELIENCTYTWVQYRGKWGALFTSKINDNWIFLPAITNNSIGLYWTGTISEPVFCCYAIQFSPGYIATNGMERYNGYNIRPVTD